MSQELAAAVRSGSEVGSGPGFAGAAEDAVDYLQTRFGWDLWTVSRTVGARQVIVASTGPWRRSACPAEDSAWAPSWHDRLNAGGSAVLDLDVARSPGQPGLLGPEGPVGAQLGVPLSTGEDTLAGVLCAAARLPQPPVMTDALEAAALLGRMLSTIAAREQAAADRSAAAAAARDVSTRDPVTGLLNRRGWLAALEVEEQRAGRSGRAVSVVSLDLDRPALGERSDGHHPGEAALALCAGVLTAHCGPGDSAARVGGQQFALLAAECDTVSVHALTARLVRTLRSVGVEVSLGSATRRAGEDLATTVQRADRARWQNQPSRRGGTAV